jgi:hypothetical protein
VSVPRAGCDGDYAGSHADDVDRVLPLQVFILFAGRLADPSQFRLIPP